MSVQLDCRGGGKKKIQDVSRVAAAGELIK